MSEYDLSTIVSRIAGSIDPTGSHQTDVDRQKNLREVCYLLFTYSGRINDISKFKDDHRDSMKQLGKIAEECRDELLEMLEAKCDRGES